MWDLRGPACGCVGTCAGIEVFVLSNLLFITGYWVLGESQPPHLQNASTH